MSDMSHNRGACIAMKGKYCVAIGSDLQFVSEGQTIGTDIEKVFKMNDHLYIGLNGLTTDALTVANKLKFQVKLYELEESRKIAPKAFLSLSTNLLYEKRFGPYLIEPVIAGLHPKTMKPFIASSDPIGSPMESEDFVVNGTCAAQMYKKCEILWQPDMEPDTMFECISQALLSSVDRDAASGWGAVVHIIEKNKVTTRKLKATKDQ